MPSFGVGGRWSLIQKQILIKRIPAEKCGFHWLLTKYTKLLYKECWVCLIDQTFNCWLPHCIHGDFVQFKIDTSLNHKFYKIIEVRKRPSMSSSTCVFQGMVVYL